MPTLNHYELHYGERTLDRFSKLIQDAMEDVVSINENGTSPLLRAESLVEILQQAELIMYKPADSNFDTKACEQMIAAVLKVALENAAARHMREKNSEVIKDAQNAMAFLRKYCYIAKHIGRSLHYLV